MSNHVAPPPEIDAGIVYLADYRRPPQAEAPRITSKHLTDWLSLHSITHERRDVCQAGVDFLCANVEAWASGGWGEFNRPQRQGNVYVACGMTMRFPE